MSPMPKGTCSLATADFAAWLAKRDALVASAAAVAAVRNDADFAAAGELQAAISKAVKSLEAERKRVTFPLDETKKAIMAEEKRLAAPLVKELERIKALNSAYATECARRREEEMRRCEDAERAAAEAALAAEEAAANDPYGFNAPPPSVPTPPTPDFALVPDMPRSAHNRVVEKWDFQITDETLVPRELCSPDERKIRAQLANLKAEGYKADQIDIKGLKISATMQVQSR